MAYTPFNTGNPIGTWGSVDPRDLVDNAAILDRWVNDQTITQWRDRFGVQRLTWNGMEVAFQQAQSDRQDAFDAEQAEHQADFDAAQAQRESDFNAFLLASGYQFIGDYDTDGPLTITQVNQIFSKDGEFWRAGAALMLPYTTVNDWATDEANFVSVGDASLRQDISNYLDPNLGAAVIGRGVVAVASVADLLLQPRRTDLQYLVRGYYADSELGGGVFVWEESSTADDNYGTILAVPGVTTGRFARVLDGDYIHTQQFGIDHTGSAGATDRLQAMVNTDLPIWLDAGTLLINKTLFYKNTTMHGPGVLNIVCDSAFTVVTDSFMSVDSAICAQAPIVAGPTYKVDLQCKITFSNSDPSKPHTPIRLVRLRDSVIALDCTCTGSGMATQTNLPDLYFDNRRVLVRGRYVLNHGTVTNAGGMWVRDVGMAGADSATYFSENVSIEDGTIISNNGNDEALSIFNPSGGSMRNWSVGAATITGAGLGFSVLEFGSASRNQALMSGSMNGTKVICTRLRLNQPVVKFDKTAPRVFGVEAHITGYDDTATSGAFFAGFRNSTTRANPEYPELISCKVLSGTATDPTSEVRSYDGAMMMLGCENAVLPGCAAFEYAVRNGNTVLGGRFPSGTTFTFDSCSSVMDARPGNVTYNSVNYRRGIGMYGQATVTPNASGEVTVTHNFGVNPVFADGNLENTNTRDVIVVSRTSGTIVFRIVDRATGDPVTSGSFLLIWKAEA